MAVDIAVCIIALFVIGVSVSLVYEFIWRYGRVNKRYISRRFKK